MKECSNNTKICQTWPKKGKLFENMNKPLDKLVSQLKQEKGIIYAYVLTTMGQKNDLFSQTGSAPNFQGSIITLCICKHLMRTYLPESQWENIWIAGFTHLMEGRNYFFYLMKIRDAYKSHYAIWNALSDRDKKVKNARYNICGDIYEPKSTQQPKGSAPTRGG